MQCILLFPVIESLQETPGAQHVTLKDSTMGLAARTLLKLAFEFPLAWYSTACALPCESFFIESFDVVKRG